MNKISMSEEFHFGDSLELAWGKIEPRLVAMLNDLVMVITFGNGCHLS